PSPTVRKITLLPDLSEPEGSLRRWRRLEADALQFQHAALRRRAAGRGKAADLAAGGQDAVAGDEQGDRIRRHGLAAIARGLRTGAEFLRQRAVGGGAAPSDLPCCRIDPLEERVLLAEVELEAGKVRLLAREIALHGSDRCGHLRRGRTGLGARYPPPQHPLGGLRAACRQLEMRDARVVPRDAAEAASGFEDDVRLRSPVHDLVLVRRSRMEIVGPGRKFNPILAADAAAG